MQVVHGRWPYGNENIKKQENEYNEMIEVSEIILPYLEKKDYN